MAVYRTPPGLLRTFVDMARTRAEPVSRARTRAACLNWSELECNFFSIGTEPVPRPFQCLMRSWI